MDKRFIAILAVLVLGLGAIFIIGKNTDKSNTSNQNGGTVSSHTIQATSTDPNAKKVALLVYGDFQCPICSQYYNIEKQLLQKYPNNIDFTFRHFPLDSIHQNARAASRAAEAAGLQGKFFEMHDLLYQNQSAWSTASDPLTIYTSYAEQLGLDTNKFKTDFASETVNNTINADLNEGNSKNVSGTPTYFINGREINIKELGSYENFEKIIQAELNK